MKPNLFHSKDTPERAPVLLAVTPPRTGERTLLGVENLLGSIADPEPFSLELAGDADGVTLMARCHEGQVIRGQIASHYPQARIREVEPHDDPLRIADGEQAWSMTLRSAGPEYVPLRTFRDDDLLDPGSDPLIALLGALSDLRDGERVVARLLLRSLGPGWAEHHQRLVQERPGTGAARSPSSPQAGTPQATGGLGMAVLGIGAFIALKAYQWVQADETWKAVLMGLAVVAGLAAAGWVKARFFRRPRAYDPLLIREKVSRIAFDAEVQVTAVLPSGGQPDRAEEVLSRVAAAYRHYDNPAGASFTVGETRPTDVLDTSLAPRSRGFFGQRSVIGVREAAALWHPPGPGDETPQVERSGARVLLPSLRGMKEGALVGDTTAEKPSPIHFPNDLVRRHHLYVARTRMGKSTLMHHIATHKMREKAEGRDPDAIVVVDPHADLVNGLLEHVPEGIMDRVRLIDLADEAGAVGINLLDARIFTDRDRTADAVVRVARGLWDQWGPRMQSILEHVVKTLHEANEHPATDPAAQYTILDGLPLLSDAKFRGRVLAKVSDPYLLEWWARDFNGWRREYRADALAPVQTRLAYYASSKRARAILGQSRSTVDLRRTILDGGILLVSTASGAVGRDVAALVGASLLNLVDAVIREQGSMPPERRRGALVVVDEMQSMPGVDYESMLSELGKFGASFILATQSLAKLEDISRTMQDTILANTGCLAVFQVAGSDARRLVWELGRDRVSEDDITSLPVHHCYVRATIGRERLPAFSMMVRRPEPCDPEAAARIRAAASSYIVSADEIAAQQAEGRRRAEEFRRGVEAMEDGEDSARQEDEGGPPESTERRKQRSKWSRDGAAEWGAGGMRPPSCEGDLLRHLASMPFLDRLEMVAVSGWSRGAVYEAVERLEHAGLAASIPHATDLVPPTRRFHLTAAGAVRLAGDRGMSLDALLRSRPVSSEWRRILLERLDAVAVIYRLASAVSGAAHPIRFRWYRAMPMDAAIALPDGRVIAVVRQGLTSDRTVFAKRLRRLWDGPLPGAVLMLTPDEARLRHASRLAGGAPAISFLALERDAASAGVNAPVWRLPSGASTVDLRTVLSHTRQRSAWPAEEPSRRLSLPEDIPVDGSGQDVPGCLLPVFLKPADKRALDLLADWPWVAPAHLGELLGVRRSRCSQLFGRLAGLGLAADNVVAGRRRLTIADRGLGFLARRDRAAVGLARQRWSAAPLDPDVPLTWRNVSGARSRQLLRNIEHTEAVHGFAAALARQAHALRWDIVQLDPPRRASRFFRSGDRLHSVRPDAFGILRRDGRTWPFFLEWERRAVRPVTMAARIAPYLRYFSTRQPADDHGAQPTVLVVFDSELAAGHFLRVARSEMARSGVRVPLRVSHKAALDELGPLGRAWRTPDDREYTGPFRRHG